MKGTQWKYGPKQSAIIFTGLFYMFFLLSISGVYKIFTQDTELLDNLRYSMFFNDKIILTGVIIFTELRYYGFFKIEDFEEVTDIENDAVIIAEVLDINQKKCGVKLPNKNYSRGQIINCKVIGYRKGRPQLEIVL